MSTGLRLALRTALAYLARNRGRATAAILSAALGAGVLAASSTLASSAQAGVAQQFRDLRSSRITASSMDARPGWASDAQLAHTARLPGVRTICSAVSASGAVPVRTSLRARPDYGAPVWAVGPGCQEALGMQVSAGRGLTAYDHATDARVALLGASVASALGLTALTGDDRVYVGGVAFAVVGILASADTAATDGPLLVYVPTPASGDGAVSGWEPAPKVIVDTEPAATDAVAAALPVSLQPADPGDVYALVGGIPTGLQSAVSDQLTMLLVALGGLSVVIGLFVMGNQTLQSVGLRRAEIALRRALGQPRYVVVLQVLAETVVCGAAGGFLGALAGQLMAGAVAVGQGWPPLADIRLVPLSALAGAVVGALAGAYPAHVASTTDPAETLKTG
ncbi:MAG: ABC transporter permease [Tessaracoccus sp.]|uniref:ABC transporter permease n=1 Tax=Tessaracoccus sp. TaxID=1971211 RepID=UPI001ECE20D0|nr:ABC transporter permease [Tessaracoccus sp.]MBK7819634.1 ABC transporter permease [Tessaracoccus sp.]